MIFEIWMGCVRQCKRRCEGGISRLEDRRVCLGIIPFLLSSVFEFLALRSFVALLSLKLRENDRPGTASACSIRRWDSACEVKK
jgi:hypothetical protein